MRCFENEKTAENITELANFTKNIFIPISSTIFGDYKEK